MGKYIKFFENFDEDDDYKDPTDDIRKEKRDIEAYHGTYISEKSDLIEQFTTGYSDYDAVWFSTNEDIAEEFAYNSARKDSDILIIYNVILKLDSIAIINDNLAEEIKDFYGLFDFREAIPILVRNRYDSWEVTGSIGSKQYDDIAVFDESKIDIISAKIKINGKWTVYLPLTKIEKILEKCFK